VAAVGRVRVPVESLPELRRRPGPVPAPGLPATFLKNADEQTVLGVAAVYQGIHDAGLDPAGFGSWGVIAAPYKIGRSGMAQSLPRYVEEGAWGMSPHLIPHRSLHSPSGAISCALKAQGPNFGVGDGASEALPIALAMLERQRVPGVWLVLTALDPEYAPDASGVPVAGTTGLGLALSLVPAGPSWQGPRLRVSWETPLGPPVDRRSSLDLFRFQALLEAPVTGVRSAPLHDLGAFGRLELSVEGEVPSPRRDPGHVTPLLTPHASRPLYSWSHFVRGAEAQR
jgi:hypothetical protein